MLVLILLLISRLINRSGLSHSKVFSSALIEQQYTTMLFKTKKLNWNRQIWWVQSQVAGALNTVARRIESRLSTLNLFVTCSRHPCHHMYDSWNNSHKIRWVLPFPKCLFVCFQYYWRYKDFRSDVTFNFIK